MLETGIGRAANVEVLPDVLHDLTVSSSDIRF
ncbi:hypothetical protein RCH22_000255 [Cryobacterium psychrotolerans]|nr:hypothetical protein [Cryobacterium psychrotolerans]